MKPLGPRTEEIYAFFREHARVEWSNRELRNHFGLAIASDVSNSCESIMARDPALKRIQRGVYCYLPEHREAGKLATGALIEIIGRDTEGNEIGRHETGALYRVSPL